MPRDVTGSVNKSSLLMITTIFAKSEKKNNDKIKKLKIKKSVFLLQGGMIKIL